MSFDWLNVPGLNNDGSNVTIEQAGQMPPPSVSFDFGSGSTVGSSPDQPVYSNEQANQTSSNGIMRAVNGHQSNRFQTPSNLENNRTTSGNQGTIVEQRQDTNHGFQKVNKDMDTKYIETPEELRVPLSLSRSQLTREEVRTYLRWYNNITLKTHSKLVRLADVFRFLSNFSISEKLRERIALIFRTCKNALNIGQFFAVLRLVSKALIENKIPNRRMILEKAPVPKPRPILNTGPGQEVYEEVEDEPDDPNGPKVDFDSFASLLLTGKSVHKRIRRRINNAADKNKRVRFSQHLTFQEAPSSDNLDERQEEYLEENDDDSDKMDLSLPMDQLLKRMAKRKEKNTALVSSMPNEQQETEEEREVLEEMKDSLSHFKQIQTVDFASMVPGSVPSIVLDNSSTSNEGNPSDIAVQPLKPTSTGSANYLFRQHFNPPQVPQTNDQPPPLPLKPTATGSANYLVRNQIPSLQQETPGGFPSEVAPSPIGGLQPLKPTATGSGNHLMKQQFSQQMSGSTSNAAATNDAHRLASPLYTGQLSPDAHLQAPQPHVSMQQQLSPPITPQSQNLQQPQHGVFSVSNPAGSYFQSLLSHSPSPNPSSTNLPAISPGSPYQGMQPEHTPTSQSRAAYNSGYQYSSPGQQQPMFTGPIRPQLRPQQSQQKSQQFIPQQHFNGGFTQPRPYAMPTSASPQSGDILSDLQSLQQQVDALQNSYSRQ